MDERKKPSYYIRIPARVLNNEKLSTSAKMLYGEISVLCNKTGYCYAGNKYFAMLYNVDRVSISLWIKNLIDVGYIQSDYKKGVNKKRKIKMSRYVNGFVDEESDRDGNYVIIPADVRYNENLSMNAKILYGSIHPLCRNQNQCWAKNEYFAKLYNVSEVSISKWINSLVEEGFIVAEYKQVRSIKTGNKRKKRILSIPNKEHDKLFFNSKRDKLFLIGFAERDKLFFNTIYSNIAFKDNSITSYYSIASFYSKKNLRIITTASSEADYVNPYGLVFDRVIELLSNDYKQETKQPTKQKPTTTTKEKIIFPTKKKPAIMSTASYKLIEKLILDEDLFFNHRLPTEKNDYKITNTIKRAVEYIDYLSAGLFIKKLPFTDDYLKQYESKTLIPNKPLIFSEVNDIIMYAVDNWKLYLTIGYMPENKEGLKKVSIDNWLYNAHTGFSWFLECLNKPAKEIKRYTANQLLDEVPEEFADKFLGLYRSIQMDDDEKSQFYRYIYYLYKRWESITEWYDGFLTRSGYRNYIGHPAVFATTLKTFLTYYTHWENWRHLKPNSAMWRDFRKHCLKEYNVDINPNKEWLDKAMIEEKEDAERTAMARRNEELKLKAEKERADRLELERMFG